MSMLFDCKFSRRSLTSGDFRFALFDSFSPCHNIALAFRVLSRRSQVSTGYDLGFQKESQVARLCKVPLEPGELRLFSNAIKEGFYYEFFVDDLPVKG